MQNCIEAVIDHYFKGTHTGDLTLLKQAFHQDAHISGNFNGSYVDFSLKDFMQRVKTTAAEHPDSLYDKKITEMTNQDNIAFVIAKVLVVEQYFIDYISLIKIDGIWKIRHKSFTTVN